MKFKKTAIVSEYRTLAPGYEGFVVDDVQIEIFEIEKKDEGMEWDEILVKAGQEIICYNCETVKKIEEEIKKKYPDYYEKRK